MSKKYNPGFTLVELLITLVIIATLFGTSYVYMSGFLPKQRLSSSIMMLLNVLKMEQSHATTKSARYGVVFKSDGACGFFDSIVQNWMCDHCTNVNIPSTCAECSSSCIANCSCSEMLGEKSIKFKERITIPATGCTSLSVVPASNVRDTIIFNFQGFAYRKPVNPETTGVLNSFEIYLKSTDSNVGVKEIEVNSSGLIEMVKLSSPGNLTSAQGGGQANVGACQ
jgi:prepilin-type N-terminal cleavage/methylation domain-containing protein